MYAFVIYFISGFAFAYFAKIKKLVLVYEFIFAVSGAVLIFLVGFDFVRISQNKSTLA